MQMNKRNVTQWLPALVGVLFLFVAASATADLNAGVCEDTPAGVAGDILLLADATQDLSADGAFIRRGRVDTNAGDRLVRALDRGPRKAGKPRRGAAAEVLKEDFEDAIASLEDYIASVQSTDVAEGFEADVQSLIDDANFLIGCILALMD